MLLLNHQEKGGFKMISTLENLSLLLGELGLYVFIEELENGNYIGVCNSIETDADIYVHDDGGASYMNNKAIDHNILKVNGIEIFTKAVSLINSYQLSKILKKY